MHNSILSSLLSEVQFHSVSHQIGFRPGRSNPDHILYVSQSLSDGFNKSEPGSMTIRAAIDFSKAFDSVWHSAFFHKLISVGLSLLALLVGLNVSFLIDALGWLFKIIKFVRFKPVEVFREDPFLVLYFFLFLSIIFLLLCLLPQHFFLCSPSGYLVLLPLGPYCNGGHTRSSDLLEALV